jgi:hypothetical protein
MAHNFIDRTGRVYGRLTVLRRGDNTAGRKARWHCLCLCGKETLVHAGDLQSGATQSCGCVKNRKTGDRARTHGKSGTTTHRVWQNMRSRCENPNVAAYKNYGGRGITVCAAWVCSFENFLADMGERPPGHSLERRNNEAGYSPENCYWATRAEQARNRRDNKWLTARGETMVQRDWAKRLGITSASLKERLDKGWSVERACTEPKRNNHKE